MDTLGHDKLGPLRDGQTAVIIGGGPAGTSCAITLRRLASRKQMPLRVLLFEHKNFAVERNICVGVLSPPFHKLLSELDLALPEGIVQRRIKGYMLHSRRETVLLQDQSNRDGPSDNCGETVVVDRADFDNFLLDCVRAAGGVVVDDSVVDVRPGPDGVLVVSSGGDRVLADVVVGAFGLDDNMLSTFEAHVPGFRRPNVTKSILAEIALDEEVIDFRLDDTIHALLNDQLPRVEFGALTPKRDRVTVNIAGEHVDDDDMDRFLKLPCIRQLVPEATLREPRYYQAFPSRPAKHIYSDRIVTIGNTSGLLRPLKGKGINTGMITGTTAATTMMEVGISKQAFDEFYRRCHDLTSEFTYGAILRGLYSLSYRLGAMDAILALARREPLLHSFFYDVVSGESSYREIIWRSAKPRLLAKMVVAIARYRLRSV